MNKYIVDLTNGFKGHTQSYTYLKDGQERVAYSAALNNLDRDLTLDEYLGQHRGEGLSVITSDTLDRLYAKHHASLITQAQQITKSDYWEMLEVLPPENWTRDEFEHFRMCEYYSGSITSQYAEHNGVYLTKRIDVQDRSTWIRLEDFAPYSPLEGKINEQQ